MGDKPQDTPFKGLGDKLKDIRQKLSESVAEVSGAVEIDEQQLERIEKGHERPSEEILLLLANHFGLSDRAVDKLWDLAGYGQLNAQAETTQSQPNNRTMVMIMAVDPRIIYSDGAQVTANGSGVVINFVQGMGTPQALVTSRIGMSRDQASALIRTLSQAMEGSKPRLLSAPESKSKAAERPVRQRKPAKKRDQ